MSATTQSELQRAFRYAVGAAISAGVTDAEEWHIQGGSKVNGVQYALVTGRRTIKLGFTKGDAWIALRAMAEAFFLVSGS